MDARSKARQSSTLARFTQCQRPAHGKSTGSYFAPLRLVEKTHGFTQIRGESCSQSRSFRGQMSRSPVSCDNASFVGREVGMSEPIELSQMSSSQSSVVEHHESSSSKSNHAMMQHSQRYPPLHQNSSSSNASSNSSCYSRSQQSRFAAHRSKMNQQLGESDEFSQCNSSTHNSANSSAASMSVPAHSVHSKGGKSTLMQRMNPRRIGSSTTSMLRKPGQHSPASRLSSFPSNLFPQPRVRQNSAPKSGAKTCSSLNLSSAENTDTEERINENQRLSCLQSELKAFVDKSMESIREKSTELDQKKSQLEEDSRNLQKEQEKLFQGRLHELNNAFDTKIVNLKRLFCEQKSHLENESASWIQSVRETGNCQVQRLSEYSQATLKKFHGAAKAAESFLRAYKQTHTDAIQALPGVIRPMLNQMMNSILPSILTEATLVDTTLSGSCKASSSDGKKPSIGRKSSVPTSKMDTGSHESSTTKRSREVSYSEIGPSKTTSATGSNKRLRRSKRIKDSSDKENLTPASNSRRTRPCVTPGGTTNEENVFSINLSGPSPSPKKSLARREPKATSTRGNKKRKISSGKSSVTPLNSIVVPSEVELSNLQESSPLTQSSRNISRPKGSTSKREKRRKSYGRVRAPKKPSLVNYMSDDTFSFTSDGIKA